MTRIERAVSVALALCALQARGQPAPAAAPEATSVSSPATGLPAAPAWAFSASVYAYFPPDGPDYLQPTVTADRGALHLEARYNYEASRTGSFWVGWNLSAGEKLKLEFTPMVGGVFGDTRGFAPGYTGTLAWWNLQFYSQGEWVIDLDDSSASFFYTWSELSLAPAGWLRLGLAVQRTKLYQTERDIQRGFLVGFTFGKVGLTGYVFNPDDAHPTAVLAAAVSF